MTVSMYCDFAERLRDYCMALLSRITLYTSFSRQVKEVTFHFNHCGIVTHGHVPFFKTQDDDLPSFYPFRLKL